MTQSSIAIVEEYPFLRLYFVKYTPTMLKTKGVLLNESCISRCSLFLSHDETFWTKLPKFSS
jgi:hypothetical protein